jgi:radical SAM superfamily enzyme YgiQ (UPF0313 family)
MRTRIDLLDVPLMEEIRAAGCRRMSIGIESGVPSVLKTLRKDINLAEIPAKVRAAQKLGFEIYLDFMIGSPGETREDILRTIAFARELDPDYAQFAITTPYPNTDLYAEGIRRGILDGDSWQAYAAHPTEDFVPQLWNEFLTRGELEELLNRTYRSFYFRLRFIARQVLSLRSPAVLLRKARAAFKMLLPATGGAR